MFIAKICPWSQIKHHAYRAGRGEKQKSNNENNNERHQTSDRIVPPEGELICGGQDTQIYRRSHTDDSKQLKNTKRNLNQPREKLGTGPRRERQERQKDREREREMDKERNSSIRKIQEEQEKEKKKKK